MANSVNSITLDDTLSHLLAEFLKQNIIPALHIDPNQLAYRWVGGIKGRLEPIKVSSSLALDDLIGIDTQKQKIVQNTISLPIE